MGMKSIKTEGRNGKVVFAACVRTGSEGPEGEVVQDANEQTTKRTNEQTAVGGNAADSLVVITANGQIIRMSVAGIRECGRGSSGVKVVDVAKNDRVISASVVPGENAEAEVAAEEAASTEPTGDGPSE